jgi:hypothetical protein
LHASWLLASGDGGASTAFGARHQRHRAISRHFEHSPLRYALERSTTQRRGWTAKPI